MFRGLGKTSAQESKETSVSQLPLNLQKQIVPEKGQETVKVVRVTYYVKDLKAEYAKAKQGMWCIVALTTICMWLIGYALLKFSHAYTCPNGAWSWAVVASLAHRHDWAVRGITAVLDVGTSSHDGCRLGTHH